MMSSSVFLEEPIQKLDLSDKDPQISFYPDPRFLAAMLQEYLRDSWFERLLVYVGGAGRWQWRLFLITSFCGIFIGFHNVASVFIAATPEHWCHVDVLDSINSSHDLRNGSVTREVVWDEKTEYSSCSYYDRNWTDLVSSGLSGEELLLLPTVDVPTRSCHKWVYDHSIYKTTAVEEWNLVCGNTYRKSLIQSTYMVGMMVGGIVFSELSDKFGRRTVSMIATVGVLVSSISVTFVSQYYLFLLFRALIAAFTYGIFLPNFIILMEAVGPEGRTIMGMMYQCFFALGLMVLAGVAYFVKVWRSLQLCISVPAALMLLYYWVLPESPRWLMLQGRYDEAFKILQQVANTNGGSLPSKEELHAITICFEEEITLLSTPNMRRRCLIIFFSWFVVSMVYYGLTFSSGNINAAPYLLVSLSGLMEILSCSSVCWTLKKLGRRLNLCVLLIICGIACLLILAVPNDMVWLNTTLATVGKFFISAAFGVAYIYSAELVPTGVRNMSVGMASMCARIGSALSPFIVDLLGDLHYAVPSSVFGLLSIVAGLMALFLPETGNTHLPDTVADVEALPK